LVLFLILFFNTNITVRCTFNFCYKLLSTNITVLQTFMTKSMRLFCKDQPELVITRHFSYYIFKAAELRNICRIAFEKANYRCRAP